jgi:dihydroorotate dehydrogenase (NAD+) catalytic subunit
MKTKVDLKTELCGVKLSNPLILASGILGLTKSTFKNVGDNGAGAITIKSLCHEKRKGNDSPTMFGFEGGFINAVGLPGQGIDAATDDFKRLDDLDVPVLGSIFGYTVEQFGEVTKKMAALNPALIEIDISCPHVDYGKSYYADPELTAKVTSICKKNAGKIPISMKLSPNVDNIKEIAIAAEKAGADAITAINTMPGMVIDINTGKPVLTHKSGGISGPALKPIAIRCVYEIYEAVKIPIIGTGGVTYGKDAVEIMMAGASAVGVGSAVYYRGVDCFEKINNEIAEFMKEHGYKSLKEIIGKAHE